MSRSPRIALYARVSKGQGMNPENQMRLLRKWAKEAHIRPAGEFVDRISTKDARPQKEEVLRLIRLGQIEGVAFYALDRWGRNMGELATEMEEFVQRGAQMISIREGLRLDEATGRLHAHIIAAFAEFERERIRERTIAGVARADAQGKIRGRHPRGCGCGWRDPAKGTVHAGPVRPVRDATNRVVGWSAPPGQVVRARVRRAAQPPPETPPPGPDGGPG